MQLHVIIQGQVQGVFFRHQTQQLATKLNITGWIRNNSDGTVEGIFQGEEKVLKEILAFCNKGPAMAHVDKVTVQWEEVTNEYLEFTIN
mgnify:CR=1 FL=1